MNCIKCGREIETGQAFCEVCLESMEKHPVKPGTVVLLPNSSTAPTVKKTPQRKRPSAEEQVAVLKKKLRRARWIAALLILLAGISVATAYSAIIRLDLQKLRGQNYSTVTSTEASTGSETQNPPETEAWD